MAENSHISRIAAQLEASPIRRMAPYLARPEIISLAGGVPDPDTFPVAALQIAVAEALAASPAEALQYGRTRGLPALVAQLASRLRDGGTPADEEQFFVTSGSQQALDLVARLLIDPGDTIVVETPTYAGALAAFRASGARFEGLMRQDGASLADALDDAVARAHSAGSAARLLYLLPNFQNPSGTSLSEVDRRSLLAGAARHNLVVIEDDPYRELWFDSPPPAAMAAMPGGAQVFYLGSLSKVLAPGLRLGFILAPRQFCERLERIKEATDLCTAALSQSAAARLLGSGELERRLSAVRSLYRSRAHALIETLEAAALPGLRFTRPRGGFFCWVDVPGVDAEVLLESALEAGVAYVAGRMFHAAGGGAETLRLAFSKEPEDRLREGANRLLDLLRKRIAG